MNDPNPLFTIGHSTHTADHFLALLRLHNIAQLVDVRTVPKSRRHPQFNSDALDNFLRVEGDQLSPLSVTGRIAKTTT